MSTDERRKVCEAMGKTMYPIINTGTRTFKQFAEAVARFARLTRATGEEVSAWEKRIKQIE